MLLIDKQISIDDIRALSPCYDPIGDLPEGWTGDLSDILALEQVPLIDRIWVCIHFIADDDERGKFFIAMGFIARRGGDLSDLQSRLEAYEE